MNFILLAQVVFTFLLSWKLKSLASWALEMARQRGNDHANAGYVRLVTASFGAQAPLIAFALLASDCGSRPNLVSRRPNPARLKEGRAFDSFSKGGGGRTAND